MSAGDRSKTFSVFSTAIFLFVRMVVIDFFCVEKFSTILTVFSSFHVVLLFNFF